MKQRDITSLILGNDYYIMFSKIHNPIAHIIRANVSSIVINRVVNIVEEGIGRVIGHVSGSVGRSLVEK